MHGEENGLRLAGYGEFFESLFALWSIGGTNNGGLEARARERGRWRDGEAGGGQHLTGSVSSLTAVSDMSSTNKAKIIQCCWCG